MMREILSLSSTDGLEVALQELKSEKVQVLLRQVARSIFESQCQVCQKVADHFIVALIVRNRTGATATRPRARVV